MSKARKSRESVEFNLKCEKRGFGVCLMIRDFVIAVLFSYILYNRFLVVSNQSNAADCPYKELEPREERNSPFVLDLMEKQKFFDKKVLLNEEPQSQDEIDAVLDAMENAGSYQTENVQVSPGWKQHLEKLTPIAFNGEKLDVDCFNVSQVSFSRDGSHEQILRVLRNCGFVVLKSFFSNETMSGFKQAYEEFLKDKESELFKYPVQGQGRIEYLIPFRKPFNESQVNNGL